MTTARHRRRLSRITKLLRGWKVVSSVGTVAFILLLWPQSMGGKVAYVRVDGHSMDGTYSNGDLVVVRSDSHYRIGEIVAYRVPQGEFGAGAQVIHRIIGGSGTTGYITKGDNKPHPDEWHPKTSDVVGRAWLHLADMGNVLASLSRPYALGAMTAGLTVASMLIPMLLKRNTKESAPVRARRPRRVRRANDRGRCATCPNLSAK